MKKNLLALVVLAMMAVTFMSACKSSERCEAYRDSSRTNTQQTINQFHSRG